MNSPATKDSLSYIGMAYQIDTTPQPIIYTHTTKKQPLTCTMQDAHSYAFLSENDVCIHTRKQFLAKMMQLHKNQL